MDYPLRVWWFYNRICDREENNISNLVCWQMLVELFDLKLWMQLHIAREHESLIFVVPRFRCQDQGARKIFTHNDLV